MSFHFQATGVPFLLEARLVTGPSTPANFSAAFRAQKVQIHAQLLRHGAVLFRDTEIFSAADFQVVTKNTCPPALTYVDGNSPRTRLAGGTYTSTEFAADEFISLHNELSYSHTWPGKIFFFCQQPAVAGGETPLVDSRQLLKALDPAVVEEFERRQLCYLRNLHGGQGMGPSWQRTFETTDRTEVERLCQAGEMQFRWGDHDRLHLRHQRPAVRVHPASGDRVWFNQADQFHPSNQRLEVYEAMQALYEDCEEEMPQYVTFKDGGAIPQAYLAHIRDVTARLRYVAPWLTGDLLLLDNMLVGHGRMPFEGARKVLVSMFN